LFDIINNKPKKLPCGEIEVQVARQRTIGIGDIIMSNFCSPYIYILWHKHGKERSKEVEKGQKERIRGIKRGD